MESPLFGFNYRFKRGARIAAALGLILASVAAADEEFVGSVIDCRALPSAEERLECYDKTVDDHPASNAEPLAAQETAVATTVAAAAAAAAPGSEVSSETAPAVTSEATGEMPRAPSQDAVSETPPAASSEAPAAMPPAASTEVQSGMPANVGAESDFGMPPAARVSDEIDEIEATITDLSKSSSGKFTITLDNGQVWRQTSTSTMRISEGDAVVIERASLGSFKLKKAGTKRSMKVKRVR